MNCEELRPDYLLYVMGTMADPEAGELRAHVARGCAACTAGLREAEALAYSMGAELKGPDAPRELRSRVLAIAGATAEDAGPRLVRSPPRVPFWARPIAAWQGVALAAACAVLTLLPAWMLYRSASESRASQTETAALLERERRSSAAMREQLQIDSAPRSTPIFALEFERGGAAAVKQLSIPKGADSVVLALPTDLVRQASAAELHDASGKVLWTLFSLSASDADSSGLTIPARLLPPGRYELVLRSADRTLAKLAFQVMIVTGQRP